MDREAVSYGLTDSMMAQLFKGSSRNEPNSSTYLPHDGARANDHGDRLRSSRHSTIFRQSQNGKPRVLNITKDSLFEAMHAFNDPDLQFVEGKFCIGLYHLVQEILMPTAFREKS